MAHTITTENTITTIYTGEYALIIQSRKRSYPKPVAGYRQNRLQDNDSPHGKCRMYFRLAEDMDKNVIEAMFARGTEPSKFYKMLVKPVFAEVTGQSHYPKFSWSRKAGCTMCPCSPGMIVDELELQGVDIWITVVKGGEREVAAYREAQASKARKARIQTADYHRKQYQTKIDEAKKKLDEAIAKLKVFEASLAEAQTLESEEVDGMVAMGVS